MPRSIHYHHLDYYIQTDTFNPVEAENQPLLCMAQFGKMQSYAFVSRICHSL